MFVIAFIVVFLLLGQDSVTSVRLVELHVRAHEREGGTALLGCQFDMEGDTLYSVKWYKDDLEFFRYVPKNDPQMTAFKRPGVYVDMSRSSSTVVALENLTRESEGVYSCEVSGEAPSFTTTKSDKRISVYRLPESGPYVTGLQDHYFIDQTAVMNCSSLPSHPKAHLQWLLNDRQVPQSYLRGPWYRESAARSDAIETTLQLRFIVKPKHFEEGIMKLKCQATIPPLYQRETKSTHYIGLPELMTEEHGLLLGEPLSSASDTSVYSTVVLLYSAFILNFLW